MDDPRKNTSQYYDTVHHPIDDTAFYIDRIAQNNAKTVLELGCGTGRVLVPLARACTGIVGVDNSDEMLERCREKFLKHEIRNADTVLGDITGLDLGRQFDLVIAPYRVLQSLETDQEVKGFLETIYRHLSPEGRGILNVFMPNRTADELRKNWCRDEEVLCEEIALEDGCSLVYSERYAGMDKDHLVLYPVLIYRKYSGNTLVEEVIHPIKMRCYYPDDLLNLIHANGFRTVQRWGGYHGEEYGAGPELVVEFEKK